MVYISCKKVTRNGKTYRYYYVGESKREGKRVKSTIVDWIGTDGKKLAAWRKRLGT